MAFWKFKFDHAAINCEAHIRQSAWIHFFKNAKDAQEFCLIDDDFDPIASPRAFHASMCNSAHHSATPKPFQLYVAVEPVKVPAYGLPSLRAIHLDRPQAFNGSPDVPLRFCGEDSCPSKIWNAQIRSSTGA
jgi:hypothetical protein